MQIFTKMEMEELGEYLDKVNFVEEIKKKSNY